MPVRQFANAGAQSTVAGAITAVQTSVTLLSASGFPAILSGGQLSVIILDSGNPAYSAATPLATPYEYQPVNAIAGNVLTFGAGGGGASRAAYAGTTPRAYFAGATVAAIMLADDISNSFPKQIDTVTAPGGTTSITLPSFGTLPQTGTILKIKWFAQTSSAGASNLQIQFNGDVGTHYFSNQADFSSVSTISEQGFGGTGVTQGNAGSFAASASLNPGMGEITIIGYAQNAFRVTWSYLSWRADTGLSGGSHTQVGGGIWTPGTLAVVTSITLLSSAGNFVAGSKFDLFIEP